MSALWRFVLCVVLRAAWASVLVLEPVTCTEGRADGEVYVIDEPHAGCEFDEDIEGVGLEGKVEAEGHANTNRRAVSVSVVMIVIMSVTVTVSIEVGAEHATDAEVEVHIGPAELCDVDIAEVLGVNVEVLS